MVSTTDEQSDRPSRDPEETAEPDGGEEIGFDEAALHGVVRDAVEDAILGVIGTVLLTGVALVVTWTGIMLATQSVSVAGTGLGIVVTAFGLYVGAATLGVVPPAREWF
ncbi:hypothetical protein M0R89_12845 [Halorussus limi]|uniref:Uncharacterized protein n=1 Tax=Halorussus limi TaxID=2938695 RepID=A0A8U0HRB4_9EURY|nr:hypothetical protein [Halorussus limi]UPV73427.1 hypothetical protein M0R89_12845 [Halorussus limi]